MMYKANTFAVLYFLVNLTTAFPQVKMRTTASSLSPPRFVLEASFQDATGDQVVSSEEFADVKVRLTNMGGAARDVVIRFHPLLPVKGLVADSTVTLDGIATGGTKEFSFAVWAGEDVQSEKAILSIEANDVSGAAFGSGQVELTLKEAPGPNLKIGKVRINGKTLGNPEALALVGRKSIVLLEIANVGKRKARAVTVNPAIDAPFVVLRTHAPTEIGDISPGEKHLVDFRFDVSEKAKINTLTLKVRITEQRQKYSVLSEVKIPVRGLRSKAR